MPSRWKAAKPRTMGQDSFTHQPRGSPAGNGPLPRQMLVEGCFLSLAEQGKRLEGGHRLACCPRPLRHLLRQMTGIELEWYSEIHPLPASVCDSELQKSPPAWPHTTPPTAPRLKETQGSPTGQRSRQRAFFALPGSPSKGRNTSPRHSPSWEPF